MNQTAEKKLFPNYAATAVEVIDRLLEYAVYCRATDIHWDPGSRDIRVRFRVDGIMEDVGRISIRLQEETIARLKILSSARTDLHTVPQDGRWQASVNESIYNIRISFMPTYYGENAVMRLLPVRSVGSLSFAQLGFTPEHVHSFDKALKKTNGLILITGPTGSGKTTTLMSCLSLKVQEPISIVTLEDPVEYEVPGVRQIHIRHSQGVTFATGLRSCLRQDPDVIMVGEIRDSETAKVAVHTALTGHLVLSTLHTNSALEAIPRLLDMGIDHYLLASTLRLVVSQRLIRALCRECFAAGCSSCRETGYSGRSVIAEMYEVDTEVRDLISGKEPLSAIAEHVYAKGMRSIQEDGREKIDWGITTEEEISRALYV